MLKNAKEKFKMLYNFKNSIHTKSNWPPSPKSINKNLQRVEILQLAQIRLAGRFRSEWVSGISRRVNRALRSRLSFPRRNWQWLMKVGSVLWASIDKLHGPSSNRRFGMGSVQPVPPTLTRWMKPLIVIYDRIGGSNLSRTAARASIKWFFRAVRAIDSATERLRSIVLGVCLMEWLISSLAYRLVNITLVVLFAGVMIRGLDKLGILQAENGDYWQTSKINYCWERKLMIGKVVIMSRFGKRFFWMAQSDLFLSSRIISASLLRLSSPEMIH